MKADFPRLVALLIPILGIVSCGKEVRTVSTPTGSVQVTRESAEPAPQHFAPLAESEFAQMKADAETANQFLNAYAPGSVGSLADFDRAFHVWQRGTDRRYSSPDVIAMLGAYLGERLVAELEMEWVVVTDQYGRDLAVRSKRVEVVSYPSSSVSKRIESGQYDFMEGIYYAVQDIIKNGDNKPR